MRRIQILILSTALLSIQLNAQDSVTVNHKFWKDLGYCANVNAGLLVGDQTGYEQNIFGLDFINSVTYKDYLSLGVGLGYEKFSMPHVPLIMEIKTMVPKWRVSPYYFLQSGYSFAFEDIETYEDQQAIDKAKGGWLFNTGAGVAIRIKSGIAFTISLAYRYQELNYEKSDWYWNNNNIVQQKNIYNRAEIKLGFQFN
jgi:hypothetical protein